MRHHLYQCAIVCTLALGIVLVTLSPIAAAPPALPPRPAAEPTPAETAAQGKLIGGWIQVQGPAPASQDVWAVVQWQDSLGKWNDVDSWRGQYDTVANGVGTKTWWVDQRLFGATMFRWSVYDAKTGQVIGSTAPFSMPSAKNQTIVTVLP